MALLFGVVASGFGVSVTFAGGAHRLGKLIHEGELDAFLSQPKPTLLYAVGSQSRASGIGDMISGLLLIILSGKLSPSAVPALVVAVVASALVLPGSSIAYQSLAWLGRTEAAARQLTDALITFSLYAEPLFGGAIRVLLFSLLPAGFVGYVTGASGARAVTLRRRRVLRGVRGLRRARLVDLRARTPQLSLGQPRWHVRVAAGPPGGPAALQTPRYTFWPNRTSLHWRSGRRIMKGGQRRNERAFAWWGDFGQRGRRASQISSCSSRARPGSALHDRAHVGVCVLFRKLRGNSSFGEGLDPEAFRRVCRKDGLTTARRLASDSTVRCDDLDVDPMRRNVPCGLVGEHLHEERVAVVGAPMKPSRLPDISYRSVRLPSKW